MKPVRRMVQKAEKENVVKKELEKMMDSQSSEEDYEGDSEKDQEDEMDKPMVLIKLIFSFL